MSLVLLSVPAQADDTVPGDPRLAASWLASQLAAGDDVITANGATDWGLTVDVFFGLVSSGLGGNQISATAAKLEASDTSYIDTQAELGSAWGRVAKMALALDMAGLDPRAFSTSEGQRDLIDDLTAVLNPDGSFGTSWTDYFSHSLAMIALARVDGAVPADALTWLLDQQCTEPGDPGAGSFGWDDVCGFPDNDVTGMAIQALRAAGVDPADPALVAAEQWLTAQQVDGGFEAFWVVNSNSTGLAAQTLSSNAGVTGPARLFIGGLQITCTTLAASTALSVDELGAIAYEKSDLDTFTADGITDADTWMLTFATAQAILGLSNSDFTSMSAAGATPETPARTCSTPDPLEPPAENPGGPSLPAHPPQVLTGGSVLPTSSWAYWVAAVCMIAGATLLQRKVTWQ